MKKLLFGSKILFISVLIVWIAVKFDAATAKEILRAAHGEWAIAALAIAALANVFVAMRWGMIIRGVWPGKNASVIHLYWFNFLALFYSIFLPTSIAGEAVRVYKLKNDLAADYPRSTITVALDRFIGAVTWLIIFLVAPSPFKGNRQWLWLLALVPLALWFFRKKIAIGEHRFLDVSRHHPADVVKAVVYSFVCQFMFILTFYALFRCFALNVGFADAAGITATTALASIVPISLLGIGLREGSLLAFLPMYGASPTQAALVTSALIFLNYFFGLAGGLMELGYSGWSFSRLRTETRMFKDLSDKNAANE